jgi:hypothetical protein
VYSEDEGIRLCCAIVQPLRRVPSASVRNGDSGVGRGVAAGLGGMAGG